MEKYKHLEQRIAKFYMYNYNLPLGQGIVSITKDIDTTTYALGFKKVDDNDGLLEVLVRSAEHTPLTLLNKLPYKLLIRSIEINETEDEITCSVRLKIEYGETIRI